MPPRKRAPAQRRRGKAPATAPWGPFQKLLSREEPTVPLRVGRLPRPKLPGIPAPAARACPRGLHRPLGRPRTKRWDGRAPGRATHVAPTRLFLEERGPLPTSPHSNDFKILINISAIAGSPGRGRSCASAGPANYLLKTRDAVQLRGKSPPKN